MVKKSKKGRPKKLVCEGEGCRTKAEELYEIGDQKLCEDCARFVLWNEIIDRGIKVTEGKNVDRDALEVVKDYRFMTGTYLVTYQQVIAWIVRKAVEDRRYIPEDEIDQLLTGRGTKFGDVIEVLVKGGFLEPVKDNNGWNIASFIMENAKIIRLTKVPERDFVNRLYGHLNHEITYNGKKGTKAILNFLIKMLGVCISNSSAKRPEDIPKVEIEQIFNSACPSSTPLSLEAIINDWVGFNPFTDPEKKVVEDYWYDVEQNQWMLTVKRQWLRIRESTEERLHELSRIRIEDVYRERGE